VFAGCLFPESAGATELKSICSDQLHILHLDVTREEHVINAAKTVKNSLGTKSKYMLQLCADTIHIQKLYILVTFVYKKANYVLVLPCLYKCHSPWSSPWCSG
jgi:hypothetical protein